MQYLPKNKALFAIGLVFWMLLGVLEYRCSPFWGPLLDNYSRPTGADTMRVSKTSVFASYPFCFVNMVIVL